MSGLKEPSPPRLSTGCELEFAVLYVYKTANAFSSEPQQKYIDDDLPQPLELDYPWDEEDKLETIAENRVIAAIEATLKAAGFPTDKIVSKANKTLAAQRLDPYRRWITGTDCSVRAKHLSAYQNSKQPLRSVSIEIATPVEWDSPDSYEVVRYAVNLLASRFRVQVNPSMGLHVHIGNGPSYMAYKWIKRMATLFWAADRLLATLNPPTRRYNFFCPGIRELSNLAQDTPETREKLHHELDVAERLSILGGVKRIYCESYLAKDVRLGEKSLLWRETHLDPKTIQEFGKTREPGVFQPFSSQDAPWTGTEELAEPEDPRVPMERYDLSPRDDDRGEKTGIPKPEAISEPVEGPRPMRPQAVIAGTVGGLTGIGVSSRPRLNSYPRVKLPKWSDEDIRRFADTNWRYSEAENTDIDHLSKDGGVWQGVEQLTNTSASCEIAGMLHSSYRTNYNLREYECKYLSLPMNDAAKRTIEWRQGAGSMDGAWVSVYMRIVAGVSRFAVTAPIDRFLQILRACAWADSGGAYDVVDFLEDLGLLAEAQVAGQRIWDLGEDWGLQYEQEAGSGEERTDWEQEEATESDTGVGPDLESRQQ